MGKRKGQRARVDLPRFRQPGQPDLLLQAVTAHQAGQFEQAIGHYEAFLAQHPNHVDALRNLGAAYRSLKRYEEALEVLLQARELAPDDPGVLNNLGNAYRSLERHQESLEMLLRSRELDPDAVNTRFNLAITCNRLERYEEARAYLEPLLAQEPENSGYWLELGNALIGLEEQEAARHAYQRCLQSKPDEVNALANLGALEHRAGNIEAALALFQRGDTLGGNEGLYSNYSLLLRDLNRFAEAEAMIRRSLELRPEFPEGLNNLGVSLRSKGHLHEAVEVLQRSIALKPDYASAHANLGSVLKEQCRFAEALACFRRAMELDPAGEVAHSNLLFALSGYALADGETILAEARRWFEQHGEHDYDRYRDRMIDWDPHRKLRVGYISPDFCRHPIAYFMEPLLRHHDRSQVEVFCYSNVKCEDDATQRLKALADHWRPIAYRSDDAILSLIAEDEIDILVDLAGHTANNNLRILARKPAPVQATYLGYFGTTGLPTIDYWITDSVLHPPDSPEHTSEEIWRLDRCYVAYEPSDQAPAVVDPPCLTNGFVTFGSFNQSRKITPYTAEVWSRVLQAVPNSRLLLKSKNLNEPEEQERIRQLFLGQGIHADRLELQGHSSSLAEHLGAYSRLDIALDTFPYTGCTTTCDALWMGVPVLTLAGSHKVQRMSASILTAIGRAEWVVTDADQLVALARTLAAHPEQLQAWRQEQRSRLEASPVRDAQGLARSMDAAFRHMWQRSISREQQELTPGLASLSATSAPAPMPPTAAVVPTDAPTAPVPEPMASRFSAGALPAPGSQPVVILGLWGSGEQLLVPWLQHHPELQLIRDINPHLTSQRPLEQAVAAGWLPAAEAAAVGEEDRDQLRFLVEAAQQHGQRLVITDLTTANFLPFTLPGGQRSTPSLRPELPLLLQELGQSFTPLVLVRRGAAIYAELKQKPFFAHLTLAEFARGYQAFARAVAGYRLLPVEAFHQHPGLWNTALEDLLHLGPQPDGVTLLEQPLPQWSPIQGAAQHPDIVYADLLLGYEPPVDSL